MNNQYILVAFLLLFMALLPLAALADDDSIRLGMLNIMRHSETKIPLKAQLYMEKRFRNFTLSGKKFKNVELGEGLSRGAEEALMEIFNEVAAIKAERPLKEVFNEFAKINREADIYKKNQEIIVLPEILDVFWVSSDVEDSQFHIICKWTIFDIKGRILYVNTIDSVGMKGKTQYAQAAEDLYKKLITQMYASKWWEHIR